MSEEINEVYQKIDELFKIKIKAQIKGSGLIFEKVLFTRNLLTGTECYNLIVNKRVFEFGTTQEFYFGLLEVIESVSLENMNEINYYEEHKRNDLTPNILSIDNLLEDLFVADNKFQKLKLHVKKLLLANE